VTGVNETISVAAAASNLVGHRRKRKEIAAKFIGQKIALASADCDRALDKLSYEVAGELRSLNCTLAAIALSDDHEEARLYLERIVAEVVQEHR